MKLKRIAGVFVLSALAFGLVACSGSDGKADPQSRSDLVNAANTICTDTKERLDMIDQPQNLRNTEQAAAYFDEASPVIESATIDFKALDPNNDTKDDWNAFLRDANELTAVSKTIADKTTKGDRSYINDISEFNRIDDRSNNAAKKLGATKCVG